MIVALTIGLILIAAAVAVAVYPSAKPPDASTLSASPPTSPREAETLHVPDVIPMVPPVSFVPSRDWRRDAFDAALALNDSLGQAGYSDAERAELIDGKVGPKLFRKPTEPQS